MGKRRVRVLVAEKLELAMSVPMSEYFQALDAVSKKRYLDKLSILFLSEKDDPYASSNSERFEMDMSLWPPVEFGHIFCYFIERPRVYTSKQLLQWKQLDAYNYYKSGFVRAVQIWDLKNSSQCVILKAMVNPSMCAPEKAHSAWIATKKSGYIVTAHCTCMAG